MTKKFYYFRDKNNNPKVTVCLVKHNNDIARGIAICSKKDNFSKKNYVDQTGKIIEGGRGLAEKRALKALTNKKASKKISGSKWLELAANYEFDLDTAHKSEFNPTLSEFEEKLTPKKSTDDWEMYDKILKSLFDKLKSETEFEISKEHFGEHGISFSIKGGRGSNAAWYSITFVEKE